jgi:hypothetical protein
MHVTFNNTFQNPTFISFRASIIIVGAYFIRIYKQSQNVFYYSWEKYKEDINSYKMLVENYHNLGNEMNLAFKRIQKAISLS